MTIHNTEFSFAKELPPPRAEQSQTFTPAAGDDSESPRGAPPRPLPTPVRRFMEGSGELMGEHTALDQYMTTLSSDSERLIVCEQALHGSVGDMRRHDARVLRAGILAAIACRLFHKPGLANKRAAARERLDFFTRLKLGTSTSRISRNLRAGGLFLDLRAANLPVNGDSAAPLVLILPLKKRAIEAWSHLVKEAGGVAPSHGSVVNYVRALRGTKARVRSIKSSFVLDACSDLLQHLPRGTPAEIERYKKIEALVGIARGGNRVSGRAQGSRKPIG